MTTRRGVNEQPTTVVYEGVPSSPFHGNSFTLNDANSTRVNNVTPAQLQQLQENDREAHRGVQARTSVLPRSENIFDRGAMMERIARRVGLRQSQAPQPIRHTETPLGNVLGRTVLDVPIQIIPERSNNAVDDRLPSRARSRGNENTFVRVGAVEVALEGLAASGTDNVLAAVLYDSRHSNPQNSIRGMQVSSGASAPTRVVYHPSTRLVLNDRANSALRLAVVSPNSDMEGWEVASARVGVVAQLDQGSHQERLTREALRRETDDRAMAMSYADHNCVVMTPPDVEPPVHGNFRIPLGRNTSMRMTGPGRWEEVAGPQRFAEMTLQEGSTSRDQGPLLRNSGVVNNWEPGRSSTSNLPSSSSDPVQEHENHVSTPIERSPELARMQNLPEERNKGTNLEPKIDLVSEFNFLPGASDTDLFLHSFSSEISTTLIPGRVVAHISMESIVNGNGRCARALKYAVGVDRAIKLVLNCKLAPMSAVGLGMAFVDSGISSTSVSCKEYLSFQSSIWNPAATCLHTFYIDPCKASEEWYPSWSCFLTSHLVIFMVDGWSTPPKTPAHICGSFYLANRKNSAMVHNPTSLGKSLLVRKFLGTFSMGQGANEKAHRAELSLGSPSVVNAGFVPTLGTQLLALHSYWRGDLTVQLTRTGSSFVGATLACALVVGGTKRPITLRDVSMIPHHTFVVQADVSSVIHILPMVNMGMMYSTDRKKLWGESRRDRGLQLAIWVKDAVTSSTDDTLKFAVTVLSVDNLEIEGHGVGYPNIARAQFETSAKYYDVAIYDSIKPKKVSTKTSPLRKTVASESTSEIGPEGSSGDEESETSPGFKMTIPLPNVAKLNGEGKGKFHYCPTPFVLLMDSAAYFKGTLKVRLMWISQKSVKFSEMKGSVSYSIHPYGEDGYASERMSFTSLSGNCEFSVAVQGPVNGYIPIHYKDDLVARPCIKIYVSNPRYLQAFHVQMAFNNDCSLAGHNISADIGIDGAKDWSEFYVE
nr:Polyprotein [Mercurialis secovirus 1]